MNIRTRLPIGILATLWTVFLITSACGSGSFSSNTPINKPGDGDGPGGTGLGPNGEGGNGGLGDGSGSGGPGGDGFGDDDDDGGPGGGGPNGGGINTDDDDFRLRHDMTISGNHRDHEVTIRMQFTTGSGNSGDWQVVQWPRPGKTVTVPGMCSKTGDTTISIELSGGRVNGARPPHKNIIRRGGAGSQIDLGFESTGTCGIFDSGILASDCGDDNVATFSCPRGNLRIEGL